MERDVLLWWFLPLLFPFSVSPATRRRRTRLLERLPCHSSIPALKESKQKQSPGDDLYLLLPPVDDSARLERDKVESHPLTKHSYDKFDHLEFVSSLFFEL